MYRSLFQCLLGNILFLQNNTISWEFDITLNASRKIDTKNKKDRVFATPTQYFIQKATPKVDLNARSET